MTEVLGFVHLLEFYKIEKHVSQTGSVSFLKWRKTYTVSGPLERAKLNYWTSPESQ
jgi:hypothetical protein